MCLIAEKSESSKNNNLIKNHVRVCSQATSHNYAHNHKNGSKIKNSGPIKISNYVKLTNKNTDVMN